MRFLHRNKIRMILIAGCVSVFAAVKLNLIGVWEAGLTLSTSSKLFKILNEFIQPFTEISLLRFMTFFAITLFLLNYIDKYRIDTSIIAKIFSGIYAFILSLCIDYHMLDSANVVNLYLYEPLRLILLLTNIVGISIIFYLIIKSITIYIKLNSQTITNASAKTSSVSLLRYFFVIFICWLPYIIILYPGTKSPDIVNQLIEFFNHGSWVRDDYPIGWYLLKNHPFTISNQHNFFVTLFYGFNFKLGLSIFHNVGVGLFFSTLTQVLLMVMLLSYALVTFDRMQMPKNTLKAFAVFFAICPMLPIMCVYLTKNILYASFSLWSILLIANAMYAKHYFKNIKWWLLFVLSIIGQLLTEKYTVYIISCVGILIVIFWVKEKLAVRLSLIMLGTVLTFSLLQSGLFSALHVPNGDPIEGESVMIQSTALYVKEFPQDLTSREKNVINKVFVLKNLPKLYTPGLSDPVKSSGGKKYGLRENGTFDQRINKSWVEGYRYKTVTQQDIKNYKRVWIRLALKHPEVVFKGFMNQGYQYLDITSTQETATNAWQTAYDSFNVSQYPTTLIINGKQVIVDYTSHFPRTRAVMSLLFNILEKIPPFSMFLNGNIYICVVILIFLVLLGLKLYKQSMLVFGFLLQVPIFMLSPVNGSQRYMAPFFFATGVILGLAYCWIKIGNKKVI